MNRSAAILAALTLRVKGRWRLRASVAVLSTAKAGGTPARRFMEGMPSAWAISVLMAARLCRSTARRTERPRHPFFRRALGLASRTDRRSASR